ncbi:MAG: hypothetical protein HY360_20750 [Verrucomicrobia bacterium]|nr:hypothetical protein [Verrucomicrobiota bacterium]
MKNEKSRVQSSELSIQHSDSAFGIRHSAFGIPPSLKLWRTSRHSAIGILLCFCAFVSPAAKAADTNQVDQPFRYLTVSGPKLKAAPTIDGTVNAEEWAGAGMAPRLYHIEEDRLMDLESKFYFGYTDEAFYLAFQIQRPEDAIEPRAGIVDRDKSFWRQDDGIEFWLNSLPGPRPAPTLRDFYLMWNARGAHYDRRDKDGNLKFNPDWQSVCRTVPGYGWEGEVRLPFKEFEPTQVPKAGDEWRYDLMDNQSTPLPQIGMSGWYPSPDWSYYAKHETFTRLRFSGDQGVFVRVLESGPAVAGRTDGHPSQGDSAHSKGGGVFEVVNPGSQAQKIAAKLKFYRKKADAKSKLSYLRSFEQSRDKGGTSDAGKVLLMVADDKLSEMIITENYDVVQEKTEDISLNANERKKIDFALADKVGDYLLLYDFRGAEGKLIAGGPLPFIIPEALEVKFANFFLVDQSVTAKIDLRYIPGWKKDSTLEARVRTLNEHWSADKLGQKFDYKFSVKDWPMGDHPLKVTAKDAAGKILAERTVLLNIPATPKWFTEKAGCAPAVPEPWTPIKVAGNAEKISFLMGDYELADTALAKQVLVRSIYEEQKIPILRGPIALKGKAGGKEIAWERKSTITIKSKKDDEVNVSGSARAGDLAVTSDVVFEYDGMAKIALTLAPAAGQKVEIDELYLEFLLKKEFSALYLRGMPMQPTKDFLSAGKVPDAGIKHPFVTSVWLGNEERGFRWFSENMKGWRVGKKFAEEAIEVLNGPEGATLKLNFIKDEKPFVLDKSRTITLAYMFTPPKTIRKDLVKIAGGTAKDFEAKAGVNAVETWFFVHDQLQGWPVIADAKDLQEKVEFARQTHQTGMKLTPYSGWFIPRAWNLYPVFGGEMIVDPLIDGGCGCDVCCWNTPVQDAYVSLFADRIKDLDLDGFRLDAGFSVDNCSSLVHRGYGSECGWLDDNGSVQPSKPLFAARRAAQRAYRLFHGGGKEHGVCVQHVHGGNRYDPILANMDAVLSVEGIEMMMKNMEELPLDFYRANVMGDAHGYQVVYLPKSRAMGFDSFYGLALLHNFNPRGGAYPVAFNEVSYSRAANSPREVWRAREWIGPFDKGTEFWGYWKNEKFLDTGSKTLIGSFQVRRGQKLLLGALNLQRKPVEGTIKLDLKALGFGEKVYAFDPILGEPVLLDGSALKLTFTPEGYRCIELAAKPFDVFAPEKIGANLIPEAAPAKWPSGGAPAGWTASKFVDEKTLLKLTDADVAVKDGGFVISSDGESTLRFQKQIGQQPGKFYMLEVEAGIECAGGAFLGEWPDTSNFSINLGDPYFGHKRTMTSQPLPGSTQKFRLFTEGGGVVDIILRKAKGKAIIKKLELYEVKSLPPGFQVGHYGQ